MSDSILWKPLLEAAGQTLIGALGSFAFESLLTSINKKHLYEGPMDLWHRGIKLGNLGEGSKILFDGVISPFAQLFPGDPFKNAQRWNELYSFDGKISKYEYQAMEFFAGSDAALRVGSFNGETLVGLYARYGFIGEGLVAVAPTALIRKKISSFFDPSFIGVRALIKATVSKCPSQLGYVAQTIALRTGIEIDTTAYDNIWYLKISDIDLYTKSHNKTISLLGSPWAVTEQKGQQYLVQYGYLTNETEIGNCIQRIQVSSGWKHAQVYYDDLNCPIPEISFKKKYML